MYNNTINILQNREEEAVNAISYMMEILINDGYYDRYTRLENVTPEIVNSILSFGNEFPDDNNVISIMGSSDLDFAVNAIDLGLGKLCTS